MAELYTTSGRKSDSTILNQESRFFIRVKYNNRSYISLSFKGIDVCQSQAVRTAIWTMHIDSSMPTPQSCEPGRNVQRDRTFRTHNPSPTTRVVTYKD